MTFSKLQGLLRTAESNLKDKSVASTSTPAAAPILAIGQGKGKKRKAPSKSQKGKSHDVTSSSGTKVGPATPSSNSKDVD